MGNNIKRFGGFGRPIVDEERGDSEKYPKKLPKGDDRIIGMWRPRPKSDSKSTYNSYDEKELSESMGNVQATPTNLKSLNLKSIEAMRIKAAPFGHNAPQKVVYNSDDGSTSFNEWPLEEYIDYCKLALDGEYKDVVPGSWVVIKKPGKNPKLMQVEEVNFISKSAYNINGGVTELTFEDNWLDNDWRDWLLPPNENTSPEYVDVWDNPEKYIDKIKKFLRYSDRGWVEKETFNTHITFTKNTEKTISVYIKYNDEGVILKIVEVGADEVGIFLNYSLETLRNITVYVQSETLELAEEPIEKDVGSINPGKLIDLDGVYSGLKPGRLMIVSGERTDIPGTSGISATELVMLNNAEHGFDSKLPNDRYHTTLDLARPLAHTYKRDSVTIYGNVVKATHGETGEEVLGSGDGNQVMQEFQLHKSPLTYLPSPTPTGAESTLEVRVNKVRWHEMESLLDLGPKDSGFISRTDDENMTKITFGNGVRGARLPTGVQNVSAVYRSGMGKSGNVKAGQIKMLKGSPLGVKGVINPLQASGGADRETRDQARRTAPLTVMALDRLVSVKDYEDFARTFAGIGKASAVRLSDGNREVVHVTIAGMEDIPIDEESDFYQNLFQALRKNGDPHQPIEIAVREIMLLFITARVRIHPDYLWEAVEPEIRAALLDAFSFEKRELGQDVWLGEVISTIQGVEGVAYVDVEIMDSVSESVSTEELEVLDDILGLKEHIPVEMARVKTKHQVAEGETLDSIARRYGEQPRKLLVMNPQVEKILKGAIGSTDELLDELKNAFSTTPIAGILEMTVNSVLGSESTILENIKNVMESIAERYGLTGMLENEDLKIKDFLAGIAIAKIIRDLRTSDQEVETLLDELKNTPNVTNIADILEMEVNSVLENPLTPEIIKNMIRSIAERYGLTEMLENGALNIKGLLECIAIAKIIRDLRTSDQEVETLLDELKNEFSATPIAEILEMEVHPVLENPSTPEIIKNMIRSIAKRYGLTEMLNQNPTIKILLMGIAIAEKVLQLNMNVKIDTLVSDAADADGSERDVVEGETLESIALELKDEGGDVTVKKLKDLNPEIKERLESIAELRGTSVEKLYLNIDVDSLFIPRRIMPAQIAFLTPEIPETLILNLLE